MSGILKCPVCGEILSKTEKTYICCNNHSYDISAKKHVNLVLANQKNSSKSGDSKEMIIARKAFLRKGYYEKLAITISEIIISFMKKESKEEYKIVDIGCGEGYYIDYIENKVKENGIKANFYGIDISKEAIKRATSTNKNIDFIVSNSFNIPIIDKQVDCIINVFAPSSNNEFIRVLKDDGIVICVNPCKEHLHQLKQMVYETPKFHEESDNHLTSFEKIQAVNVKYEICLKDKEDIKNLYMMTPYYWRTKEIDRDKLYNISNLSTFVDFEILVFRKN